MPNAPRNYHVRIDVELPDGGLPSYDGNMYASTKPEAVVALLLRARRERPGFLDLLEQAEDFSVCVERI